MSNPLSAAHMVVAVVCDGFAVHPVAVEGVGTLRPSCSIVNKCLPDCEAADVTASELVLIALLGDKDRAFQSRRRAIENSWA